MVAWFIFAVVAAAQVPVFDLLEGLRLPAIHGTRVGIAWEPDRMCRANTTRPTKYAPGRLNINHKQISALRERLERVRINREIAECEDHNMCRANHTGVVESCEPPLIMIARAMNYPIGLGWGSSYSFWVPVPYDKKTALARKLKCSLSE